MRYTDDAQFTNSVMCYNSSEINKHLRYRWGRRGRNF